MPDRSWQLSSKCRSMDMSLFFDESQNSRLLCAGCRVIEQCDEQANELVNVTQFLALSRDRVPNDELDDLVPVGGVTMAGRWIPEWDGVDP